MATPCSSLWTSKTAKSLAITDGPPDSLMAGAASYSETLSYGAQTPFSDQLAFHWVGSLWQYDALHDSIITVGNGGTKPALAALTLYYGPDAKTYEIQQNLEPASRSGWTSPSWSASISQTRTARSCQRTFPPEPTRFRI